jgi:hypothetical protein
MYCPVPSLCGGSRLHGAEWVGTYPLAVGVGLGEGVHPATRSGSRERGRRHRTCRGRGWLHAQDGAERRRYAEQGAIESLAGRGRTARRIGDPTVPGRSYHLHHRHQAPEMCSTFLRDRSKEIRRGRFEETRARYCARNRGVGRAERRIGPSPGMWRATRSGRWRWITSYAFGPNDDQGRRG